MSEPSKRPRKKKKLPDNVEELTDDEVARILFGDKAVDEANRLIEHEPPEKRDKSSDKE